MNTKLQAAVSGLLLASLFLSAGCDTPAPHPGQINSFDGATYDTLTVAHGALTSLRVQVATTYPKYIPRFNQAAAAYQTAYNSYSIFRTNPANQAETAAAMAALTASIVVLETSFESDLQAPPATVANFHSRARKIRAAAVKANLTVSDILTELEIVAAVASVIPASSKVGLLAQLIIQTTSAAIAAQQQVVGQAIDLSLISPVAPIA